MTTRISVPPRLPISFAFFCIPATSPSLDPFDLIAMLVKPARAACVYLCVSPSSRTKCVQYVDQHDHTLIAYNGNLH